MNRLLSTVAATAVVAVMLAAYSPTAMAFKRTETCDSYGTHACDEGESPKDIFWPVRCVEYRINEDGSRNFPAQNGDEIAPELRSLVNASFQTWNDVSCADFSMVEGKLTSSDRTTYEPDDGFSGNKNVVVWRDQEWPHRSDSAFAVTSVTFNSESGRIADADIEINSAFYDYADLAESEAGENDARVDLRNTLTHEVGHFLGLDHPDVEEATMYGRAPIGEIEKRTLHSDDESGVCAIYPVWDGQTNCELPDNYTELPANFTPPPPDSSDPPGNKTCGNGCTTSDGPPAPWMAIVLFVVLRRNTRRDDVRTQAERG